MPRLRLPAYEKVETIVYAFLHHGSQRGACGMLIETDMCRYVVNTDCGEVFQVRCEKYGWRVQYGDFVGLDRDLLDAAMMAFNAAKGH